MGMVLLELRTGGLIILKMADFAIVIEDLPAQAERIEIPLVSN